MSIWDDDLVLYDDLEDAWLSADTLSTIEQKIEHLSNDLATKPYDIQTLIAKNWNVDDVPRTGDIKNISDHIETLTKVYYAPMAYNAEVISNLSKENLTKGAMNTLIETILQIHALFENAIHHNTWESLGGDKYTYGYLQGGNTAGENGTPKHYTYEHLRRGLDFPDFLEDDEIYEIEEGAL